jgi:hypothetical protein
VHARKPEIYNPLCFVATSPIFGFNDRAWSNTPSGSAKRRLVLDYHHTSQRSVAGCHKRQAVLRGQKVHNGYPLLIARNARLPLCH